MLVSFAQDMFPDRSAEDIGVWPAEASSWSRSAAAEQSLRIDGRNGTTSDRNPARWHARVGTKVS